MNHLAVVLAAGLGTRMNSDLPKVLHRVAGRTMLGWVLDAVLATDPARIIVVVGHGADGVVAELPQGVEWCLQEDRRGTGHATQIALAHAGEVTGQDVLVVPGDTPLITGEALGELLAGGEDASVRMLTAEVADPTGYGRVIRKDGVVGAIVEQNDADAEQRAVREINAGMYLFRGAALAADIAGLKPDNAQGELYLTDVVGSVTARGDRVEAVMVGEVLIAGINTLEQLAAANKAARTKILSRLMDQGVTIVDPERTYIDADVVVEPGAVLYPGCHLEGGTRIEAGAVVGPDVFAHDSRVGPRTRAWYSVLRGVDIGADCDIGPYANLRPGTILEVGAKAGSFVELKKATLGEGAKVPHLSYMGDATIGANANVGAGSITCNYDGYSKHETHIGADAFVGSDTMLVAPVTIGEGAATGAGSVITSDVPPGALGVERAEQRNVAGYAAAKADRYRSGRATGDTKER